MGKDTLVGKTLVNHQKKRQNKAISSKHSVDIHPPKNTSAKSVISESNLDEFIATADLANRDFTAERANNVAIVDDASRHLRETVESHDVESEAESILLSIPRKPFWIRDMSASEVDSSEKSSFLAWRRRVADICESANIVVTPFERNIEFWRQLWRVVERSDLLVQIVDARNPLLFRCDDFERYVSEVDGRKAKAILVNKSDYLSKEQRHSWAEYFKANGISVVFFSALLATKEEDTEDAVKAEPEDDNDSPDEAEWENVDDENEADGDEVCTTERAPIDPTDILSADRLLDVLESLYADQPTVTPDVLTIGMVGYPNVGKSSTINAILQKKAVSVSRTPGKTKHFQTLFVTPYVMLCDCPGLVMPSLASSREEMIVAGIISIDEIKEYVRPMSLVCERIPRDVFEAVYGVVLPADDHVDARVLLERYALLRGFSTAQRGVPDVSRAARVMLKDYVNGRLVYCHAPPGADATEYTSHTRQPDTVVAKLARVALEREKRDVTQPTVQPDEFDQRFFRQMANSRAHNLGHAASTRSIASSAGPAKAAHKMHNNRNKREKLRRVYKDFDFSVPTQ